MEKAIDNTIKLMIENFKYTLSIARLNDILNMLLSSGRARRMLAFVSALTFTVRVAARRI